MYVAPSQPRGIYNSLLIEKEENANIIHHLQNIINDSKTELSELQKQIKANKHIYQELKMRHLLKQPSQLLKYLFPHNYL